MSHLVAIKTELRDLAAIKAACVRLGWTFAENQKTYAWHSRWVDDSPVPRHLFAEDEAGEKRYQEVVAMTLAERTEVMHQLLGKCDHAIKIPGCTGEVGLIRRGGNYIPIWDFAGGVGNAMCSDKAEWGWEAQDGGPLLQAYGIEKSKLEAKRQGYGVSEVKADDGSVKLQIRVGGSW